MHRVPRPCSGCRNALCYICTRYPGGLNSEKPMSLMYFDDWKWQEFPRCILPTLLHTFMMRESIVHVDGHSSHIIDFEHMIMVNTKTGDHKPLAWRTPLNSTEGLKPSYATVDLTLKLGVQPNLIEENKMKGNQVNNENKVPEGAEKDGGQEKMEDDPVEVESCGSNDDHDDILLDNFLSPFSLGKSWL